LFRVNPAAGAARIKGKHMLKRIICAVALLVCLCGFLFAQRGRSQGDSFEVKVASPLPENSLWGNTLNRMAAEWNRITNGQVRMRIIHGGMEGGEAKMLASLGANQIQAAVFTTFGLSAINPAVITISCPFLIRNNAEFDLALREVQDDFETRINSTTNFMVVAWSKAGWINVFSRDAVLVPDDLKRQKLATNADANDLNTAFTAMGFQLVDTDIVDVAPKLASGAVNAVYQSPAAVAAYRLHSHLRNMLSINIAPFLGGIVINKVTWERINPQYRDQLLRYSRRMAAELDASMQRTSDSALAMMTREGLRVHTPSPAQEQLWTNEVERVMPSLLGRTFDQNIFQKIDAVLRRYRSGGR
jgi:TRAP-type C4-dicarboxylate transport system substrate-binding protein